MPKDGVRSTYSQCPFQIYMYDDGGLISTGTAFFYNFFDESFLITNWHNLTGRHFLTKKPLSTNSRLPTLVKAKFATVISGNENTGVSFTTVAHKIPIYDDSKHKPLWFEHPDLGSDCDVIALPFSKPSIIPSFMHNYANKISSINIPVKPGNTVFIIGFPKSISVGFGLPLWKSGYISSEPHYDVTIDGQIADIGGLIGGKKLPAFFIDSQTREGLSGSPVFSSFTGTWDTTDPYKDVNPDAPDFFNRNDIAIGGNATQFIGIYSGRISGKEDDAALGLCWREATIIEICQNKKVGSHPL